jgi:DNA gyrase subunit A
MANNNGAAATNGAPETNGAIGNVRAADITQEMQVAYLDYAMSVIVARALPDVRDGLKPVHRRILYALWHDLSLTYDKPHKKSARIVGEVLGKYHPHGDAAVYDAMVRMAQNFSLRYPLIDGQGNFGSIDGDNAAAMRYTEARLAKIANLVLEDLEKDTVDWHPNFDNTLREPDILPAALPNLLINGSSGIAVGMATNIPPHNLGEVVDALVYVIDHYAHIDDISIDQLLEFIKGPDFPTGGIIYRFREGAKDEGDIDAIAQGYSMGKSRLIMQAKAHFEEISRGRTRIVITELPYQTNKTALIERIADLVRDGKLEGIGDLRDESDRTGMRIVVELTRTVEPKDVLANLFKYTPLQQTFGMQLLALVDGQPRLLNLKRMLHLFIQHRQEIIRRRSEFDLARARERAHIVEGLLRALDILDEVIQTIRRSQTADTARKNLISNFHFSEVQAQAILDMQLRRLAALERRKLQDEFDELRKRIAYLEDLLAHPEKMLGVIKDDLLAIKAEYADPRRTQIVDRTRGTLTTTDLLPDQMVWVSLGKNGDLRRQAVVKPEPSILRQVGKESQAALVTANTRDYLYVFSRDGRCSRIGVHEIPEDGSKKVSELTGFQGRDAITAAVTLPRTLLNGEGGYLFLATTQGIVKRVAVSDVQANTGSEFTVINVEEKDRLGWVLRTQGSQEVLLVTAEGQSIRFAEDEVRSMGLPAAGVGGIKLAKKDSVIAAAVVDPAGSLVTLSAVGFCKRTLLSEYGSQGRNGSGIVAHKTTAKTGQLVAATVTPAESAAGSLIVVPAKGQVRIIAVEQTPLLGRGVQGKLMVETGERDVLSALWYAPGAPGSDDGGGDSVAAPAKAAPPAKPLTKPVQAGLDVVTPRSKAQPAAAQPAVAEPAAPVKRPPAVAEPSATPAKQSVAQPPPATAKATKTAAPAAAPEIQTAPQKPAKVTPRASAPATAPAAGAEPATRPAKAAAAAPAAAEDAPVALQFDFVAEEPAVKKTSAKPNAKLATVASVTKAQAGAAKKK